MANFEDFPPIFCPTADFLPQGGGALPCKIFTSGFLRPNKVFWGPRKHKKLIFTKKP